ncbi:serine hydrolase domain-containing protein [Flaviramulus aquimarinus]|uniref:Serine hydrolase domain-containing protein n=2 Tax=Flaviramulus aquimarinus TaxID=1170456 RepID=A0ABP9F8H4_9FLAO
MDSLYNTGVFNGFAATIVDTTGIIYNQGFGYANVNKKKKYTENTIINIASISKVFIGAALLKAKEMNVIDLDDPINTHLPFQVINPNHPNELITIRQLATHTSSIVDTDIYMETCYVNKDDIPLAENLKEKYGLYYQNPSKNWIPLKEYLGKILQKDGLFYNASTFSKRKPGAVYEYSNIGAALCALVIESATKKPFNEFTRDHIFKPLQMSSTSWFFEDVDHTNYSKLYFDNEELPYYKILSYPDGGLITSSTDLGKFLTELIKGYSGHGTILNSNSYNAFFKSQLDEQAFESKKNYNVGLFIEKELPYHVIGHTGGDPGTNTMMFFDSETKTGRIFITNTDSKKENSGAVFWGIWNALGKY